MFPGQATRSAYAAVVLAHQGGWDEVVLVAAPIAFFAVVLWLANRRAGAAAKDDDPAQGRLDD